jgi:O-acetyl-ADP-ribose deacetylase (regulator of RNase III)
VAIDGPPAEVRFGRTAIATTTGDLFDQGVEAVVVPANCRGVMGAVSASGLLGLRSFGGSTVEREAMTLAPLALGSAVVTGAAGLEARGIRAVIHAVVHPEWAGLPGSRTCGGRSVPLPSPPTGARLRTIAIPLLGAEGGGAELDPEPVIRALVDELVGCLRRSVVRLDRVVIVGRFDDHRRWRPRA